VLAFTRGQAVLCVFNLSPETHRVGLTGAGAVALAQGAEHGRAGTLTLHPNGFAIMEASADVAVSDAPTCATSPVP
jgi:alpha-glucosidase